MVPVGGLDLLKDEVIVLAGSDLATLTCFDSSSCAGAPAPPPATGPEASAPTLFFIFSRAVFRVAYKAGFISFMAEAKQEKPV